MMEHEGQAAPPKIHRKDYLPKPEKKEQKKVTFFRAVLLAAVDQKYLTAVEAQLVFEDTLNHLNDLLEDRVGRDDGKKLSAGLSIMTVAKLTSQSAEELFGKPIPFAFHMSENPRETQFCVRNALKKGDRVVIVDDEAHYLINARVDGEKVRPTAIDPTHPQRKEVLKNRHFQEMLRDGWLSLPRAPQIESVVGEKSSSVPSGEIFSAEDQK